MLKRAGDREQADRVADAVEKMPALLAEVVGLEENSPAVLGQVVGEVTDFWRAGSVSARSPPVAHAPGSPGVRQRQHARRFQFAQAPLRIGRELAERFDLVAEQLQP